MSSDISRVYLFLAQQGDWVSKADANGDGYIIKTEFVNFMNEEFTWNGEETNKDDLINNFWKTVDTKQTDKVKGTKLKDKNALNQDEMAAMETKIQMYEVVNNFASQIEVPGVIYDTISYKQSILEGLAARLSTQFKKGGSEEEYISYINQIYPSVKALATADYCANQYLEEVMSDINNDYNYAYGSDTNLKGIIDTYVKSCGAETDADTINNEVKELIDGYLATAQIGSGDTSVLADYGYRPTDKSPLNDLQKSVLIGNTISEVKADETELAKYELAGEAYTKALDDFLTNTKKYGDFSNLNAASFIEEFKASTYYKGIQEAADAAELQKLREEAIEYCKTQYARGGAVAKAVIDIFGNSYETSIKEADITTLKTNLEALKAKIEALGDPKEMSGSSEVTLLNSLSDSYNISTTNSRKIPLENSFTYKGKVITSDRITFKSSDTSVANISGNGELQLASSNPGTYVVTISAMVDGVVVKTKDITVKVLAKEDIAKELGNKNIPNKSTGFMNAKNDSQEYFISTYMETLNLVLDSVSNNLQGYYNEADIQNAIEQAKAFYETLFNAIATDYIKFGRSGDNNDKHGHSDADNYKEKFGDEEVPLSYKKHETDTKDLSSTSSSGIALAHSYNKNDTYRMYFNGTQILKKVLSFMN